MQAVIAKPILLHIAVLQAAALLRCCGIPATMRLRPPTLLIPRRRTMGRRCNRDGELIPRKLKLFEGEEILRFLLFTEELHLLSRHYFHLLFVELVVRLLYLRGFPW